MGDPQLSWWGFWMSYMDVPWDLVGKLLGFNGDLMGFNGIYPLVSIQKTMERSTMFNGKTHHFQ